MTQPLGAELERLEARMIDAELAGRTTLADALARRIEALRAGVKAGNVIAFRKAVQS